MDLKRSQGTSKDIKGHKKYIFSIFIFLLLHKKISFPPPNTSPLRFSSSLSLFHIFFSFVLFVFFSSTKICFPFQNTFTFSFYIVLFLKKKNDIFFLQIFSEYQNISKRYALFTLSSFNCFLFMWRKKQKFYDFEQLPPVVVV